MFSAPIGTKSLSLVDFTTKTSKKHPSSIYLDDNKNIISHFPLFCNSFYKGKTEKSYALFCAFFTVYPIFNCRII